MRKIIFTFLLAVFSQYINAQTSDSFNYQAIVRNSTGTALVSQSVSFRINILKGSASGSSVYSEKHAKTTSQFGLVTLSIGNGTDKIGNLTTIDWSADIYFLKVELDASGGTNYTDLGATQLLSVPIALHAKTADNGFSGNYNDLSNKPTLFDGKYSSLIGSPTLATIATSGSYNDLTNKPIGNNIGDMQYWDGVKWEVLPRGSNGQIITMNSSNIPTWQDATSLLALSAPATSIQAATNIQFSSATISGTVNANGLITTVSFEWGLSTSYGNNVLAAQNPITGNSSVIVNTALTGLQLGTTYHYRIKASNAVNISYSNDMTFTTPSTTPSLTTSAISTITSNSAVSGGYISSDGGSLITARGVCWSNSSNPTIANFKTVDGSGIGGFSSSISGLTTGITYYVRAYATNSNGTVYGNEKSFIPIVVGDNFQGGIVAYFFSGGDVMGSPPDEGYVEGEQHGLIVAQTDQSTGAVWGCAGTGIANLDSCSVGYGAQNTNYIITGCTSAGIAAKICYDLVLNGYSDWYLPNSGELSKIYFNKNLIGGFTNSNYWSSCQKDNNNAWFVNFSDGTSNYISKSNSYRVRAVRNF